MRKLEVNGLVSVPHHSCVGRIPFATVFSGTCVLIDTLLFGICVSNLIQLINDFTTKESECSTMIRLTTLFLFHYQGQSCLTNNDLLVLAEVVGRNLEVEL